MGKGRTMAGEPENEAAQPRQDALQARRQPRPHLHEIIAGLAEAGIEYKSVYRDLDALRDFGLDIAKLHYPVSYALVSRTFTAAELMLTDAVSHRRFLTVRMAIASPKGWRLWAPATRPPRFPERARGRPHQDAEQIGVPPWTTLHQASRRHRQVAFLT